MKLSNIHSVHWHIWWLLLELLLQIMCSNYMIFSPYIKPSYIYIYHFYWYRCLEINTVINFIVQWSYHHSGVPSRYIVNIMRPLIIIYIFRFTFDSHVHLPKWRLKVETFAKYHILLHSSGSQGISSHWYTLSQPILVSAPGSSDFAWVGKGSFVCIPVGL